MYRLTRVVSVALLLYACCTPCAYAQHQHEQVMPDMPGQHADHEMEVERQGSGTAWLPPATPMFALHWQRGTWALMAHGNVFVQFLDESGERGDNQAGSINWIMGMARRPVGAGRVTLRGMMSLEPWTIGGCGYPDLLASGEQCNGETIHDLQHPHDLLMEISGTYDAPLHGGLRWQIYGGPAGEPALGPVAFPHRLSAMPNPIAPISHHWLDSTHVTFGVITGGVYGDRWKAETSAFNGREPDEHRANIDFGALDSFAGRVWFVPTPRFAVQVSAGRLTEAEASGPGLPRANVTRTTASMTYHGPGVWATTLAWGQNAEEGHTTNALLIETNYTQGDRNSWFGRFETVGKTGHDLAIESARETADTYAIAKLQGGYARYLREWKRLRPGFGASLSASFVPASLETIYGSRVNTGVAVFFTLRPAAMVMVME